MQHLTILFIATIIGYSCNSKQHNKANDKEAPPALTSQLIREKNTTPTVDIKEYTLIAAPNEQRQQDAAQILALKRQWPLVMQAPSRAGFDSILSSSFTFYGEGKLFNREDYIANRTQPSDWKITQVKYDNMTLQFFGNTAVMTYRNQVTNEHIHTRQVEMEYISWADVYVKENDQWKIGASHTVDVRVEPQ